MMLWLLLGAMTVIATAVVAIPLLRRPGDDEGDVRRAANLSAYRLRLREIERECADGQMSGEEAEAAKTELAAHLLADEAAPGGGRSVRPARRPWWALVAVLILVPAAAGVLYWQQGSGERYLHRQQIAQQAKQLPSAGQMVAELKAQLQRQPGDIQGWSMLGRAYSVERHYDAAAKAFGHANALTGNKDATLLVAQGQALALAAHGDLHGQATQLFESALKLDPSMPQALFYVGLAAYQRGDYHEAVKRWQTLYNQDLPADFKQLIRPHLNAARAQVGLSPIAGTAKASTADSGLHIPVQVSLAPGLAGKLSGKTTVYIFARAAHGPKMPLAVVRSTVGNLPQTVELSDGMSMVGGLKLSAYKAWVITARVSKSGDAGPAKPGDYQASARLSRGQLPTTVHLTIARAAGG